MLDLVDNLCDLTFRCCLLENSVQLRCGGYCRFVLKSGGCEFFSMILWNYKFSLVLKRIRCGE